MCVCTERGEFRLHMCYWQKWRLCAQLIITLPFLMLFWQHLIIMQNMASSCKIKIKQECHEGGAININRITIAIIYYKVYMFIYLEPQDISCIGSFVFMSDAGIPCKQPYKLRSFHLVRGVLSLGMLWRVSRHTLKPRVIGVWQRVRSPALCKRCVLSESGQRLPEAHQIHKHSACGWSCTYLWQ